jgi:GT2 family glycosyltransferase/glycosyltransferase involved in cell wall biosynthesis
MDQDDRAAARGLGSAGRPGMADGVTATVPNGEPREVGPDLTVVQPAAVSSQRVVHLPERSAEYSGKIDRGDWNAIEGWAWNRLDPASSVCLDVFDGDCRLATIAANLHRTDLQRAGMGDGRHAFRFPLSRQLLTNARHLIHIRPAGTGIDLVGSPIVLAREDAGFDAEVVKWMLGNVGTEASFARKPEDLAPMLNTLAQALDRVGARYFELTTGEEVDAPAAQLNSVDLSSDFAALVKSLYFNYPPVRIIAEEPPLVSVVVPVYNNFNMTYRCLASVEAHGAKIPFEVIIVDDCSHDETLLAGLIFHGAIRLVRNPTNLGFVRSCNRGRQAASAPYLIFLNNDTEVTEGWLDELYETLSGNEDIGIVGAKLLFPDGKLQECGGIIWRLGDGWNWGRGQDPNDPKFCYMRDVDYVSGAALMIRAHLFDQLGGFDEYYAPAYYEDTDLCFKVRESGRRTVVQPTAEVIHYEGASAGTDVRGSGMKRFQAVNHRKFFERWKDVLVTHRFNGQFAELEAERAVERRALFIDDSVPEPDKDAGSNAAFQHMLSLQRLGYKVTFIPADNWAKIDPYTRDLQRLGIECLYRPHFASIEDAFQRRPESFDIVYLHRHSNASKYAGMIRHRQPSARILYNVADLHFLRTERQSIVKDDDGLRAKAAYLRRMELGVMSLVDCVIVHSPAEARLLRSLVPDTNVAVVPWTIPVKVCRGSGKTTLRVAFIGSYRHPPNVDAAHWFVDAIMPQLRQRQPGITLLLVGSHMPTEVSSLSASDVKPVGHVPSLDTIFEQVRLTVAPLRFGAGIKGKILDSLAAGIPCVMTSIGAEGLELPAELQDLVVDEPDRFAGRIAELCHDDARYQRVAAVGLEYIRSRYSRDSIDELLRAACNRSDTTAQTIAEERDVGIVTN